MGPSSHEPGGQNRTAWFHCHAGIAGDMVLGALVDAGASPDAIVASVAGLGLEDWALSFEEVQRGGLRATHAVVAVLTEQDHHHHPEHQNHPGDGDAAHTHGGHRRYGEIRDLIAAADLTTGVRDRALAVFAALAEVEGRIHACPPEEVEFHEVGSLDAIVDIVGVCAALEDLGVDTIVCSPITVGRGTVLTAHGRLPHPVPAVLELAARSGLVLTGVDEALELATPTGVALMAALASSTGAMPEMTVTAVGHGAGTRDTTARPNVIQVVVGTPASSSEFSGPGRPAIEIEANIDDATPEVLAHTVARLLDSGAHDAWITPIVMKKGRPAFTLHALGSLESASALMTVIVTETGTLGIRAHEVQRWPQTRDEITVVVHGHPVRVKRSSRRIKVEFDDAVAVANATGLAVREVLGIVENRGDGPEPDATG
jgi:uncharacterized protein (TIGR00299 family) protein